MIENRQPRGTPAERLAELEAAAWELLEETQGAAGEPAAGRDAKMLLQTASRLQSMIALDFRIGERARKEARPKSPLLSPEWQRTKRRVLEALDPYPEALAAVTEALRDEN